jgi:hypothetical protein
MKGCLVAGLKIFAGLVILAIAYIWLSFYDIHVRYRLTFEVRDGEQIKTGASVIDTSYTIQPDWLWSGPDTHVRVVGYAPTVDLGNKGMLFLTFVNATRTAEQYRERTKQAHCSFDDIGCLSFAAYDKPGVRTDFRQRKAALDELLRQSGPRDVPFAVQPELVRFKDINDPNTRLPVSPNDLAAAFGPGVELKRVILQLTGDPVTPPPENWPQWLKVKRQYTEFRGYEKD